MRTQWSPLSPYMYLCCSDFPGLWHAPLPIACANSCMTSCFQCLCFRPSDWSIALKPRDYVEKNPWYKPPLSPVCSCNGSLVEHTSKISRVKFSQIFTSNLPETSYVHFLTFSHSIYCFHFSVWFIFHQKQGDLKPQCITKINKISRQAW